MKILFSIILLSVSLFLFSQNKSLFVEMQSFSIAESRSVRSNFVSEFYRGHFLDSALKNKTSELLKSNNVIGFMSSNSIVVEDIYQKGKCSFFTAANFQSISSLNFSKPSFELAFIGNKNFENKETSLSPINFYSQQWSDIQFGITKKFNDNFSAQVSIGPAFGFNMTNVDIKSLSMSSSNNFDSINISLNAEYCRVASFPTIKAYGFSASVALIANLSDFNITAKINNIGSLTYNKKSMLTKKSFDVSYNGLSLNSTTNLSTSLNNQVDSLSNLFNLAGDTSTINVLLPLYTELKIDKTFDNFATELLVSYINVNGFIPYFQLTFSQNIGNNFKLSAPIKYGGFGGFNIGLAFETKIYDKLNIKVATPTILSLLGLSKKFSLGLLASLSYKI